MVQPNCVFFFVDADNDYGINGQFTKTFSFSIRIVFKRERWECLLCTVSQILTLSFKTETLSLENRYYKYMNAVDFTLDSQPRIRLNVL